MRSHRSIPKQKHVKRVSRLAQLLPRLRSCCQGDCAGIVHFLAAVRPGETDPYMLKVGKSTLCMQEHNSRANGCLGRALRRYKHCAVEKASGWRAMKVLLFTHEAHAWEFESGFHSIARQTYPASLLYNADVWTEVRDTPKHRSRSNWEVCHGANLPELLSLADRLFRLSRAEFLPMRAEAWQRWTAAAATSSARPSQLPCALRWRVQSRVHREAE